MKIGRFRLKKINFESGEHKKFHELLRINLFNQPPEAYYCFDHDNYFPLPTRLRRRYLLFLDSEPVAAATLDQTMDGRTFLRSVAVASGVRCQGIGRALVQAVNNVCWREGTRQLHVYAGVDSAGFYRVCGFRSCDWPAPEIPSDQRHMIIQMILRVDGRLYRNSLFPSLR